MKKLLLFSLCVSLLVGCSTSPVKSYEELQEGATKGIVLHQLGNPNKTYRKHSEDIWVYIFPNEDSGPIVRELVFREGRMVRKYIKGDPKPENFKPLEE